MSAPADEQRPSDRWRRIEELFALAAELSPAERAALLSRECGDDDDLRRELERLLAADATPISAGLTRAVGTAIDEAAADRGENLLGSLVGAYRLVSILGRGGSGTVYLAQRIDREYTTQVAVKVVDGSLMDPDLARRIRAERQILADLDHPGIARLLDAGATACGEPCLIMEYVRGEPIDAYCDRARLDVAARVRLFLQVCTAVEYAHRNLVVHRDLKPANILVTPAGVPKLLDFGIAKLLDTRNGPAAAGQTRLGERLLTPQYASPEQFSGGRITTASDVYALGVVLYELLSGRRPYDTATSSPFELERAIWRNEPPPPSLALTRRTAAENTRAQTGVLRSTTPHGLRKSLRGDLDAIVLKALRREPAQRYGSVEQLTEDLRRYLNSEPVRARRGGWSYTARRFLVRNAAGVAVSFGFVLAIAAFAAVNALQARHLAAQRDRASEERARAEAVSAFVLEVFGSADPFATSASELTARELLDMASTRIAGDTGQDPEVRARLLETLGHAYLRQGVVDTAFKLLDEALQARNLQRPRDRLKLATAQLELGELLLELERPAEAAERLQSALEQWQAGDGPASESARAQHALELARAALEPSTDLKSR